jgi:cytochrome c2
MDGSLSGVRGLAIAACAAAVLLAGLNSLAVANDGSIDAGRKVFAHRCQTCHGGTRPADSPIGPDLRGIVGRKAATQHSGVHSRAALESGVVWDRKSLRRFLAAPQDEIPGTIMPVQVTDPKELDELLDYLESLR